MPSYSNAAANCANYQHSSKLTVVNYWNLCLDPDGRGLRPRTTALTRDAQQQKALSVYETWKKGLRRHEQPDEGQPISALQAAHRSQA